MNWSRDIVDQTFDAQLGLLEVFGTFVALFLSLAAGFVKDWQGRCAFGLLALLFLVVFATPIGLQSKGIGVRNPPPGTKLLSPHDGHALQVAGVPIGTMHLYRVKRRGPLFGDIHLTNNTLKVRTGMFPLVPPVVFTNGSNVCGYTDAHYDACIDGRNTRVKLWRDGDGFIVTTFGRDAYRLSYGFTSGAWLVQWAASAVSALIAVAIGLGLARRRARRTQ